MTRVVASEVEEHRRPAATWFARSGCLMRCMRLIRPPGVASTTPVG